ncbi:glycosyltransferase [Metallosphaera tengchongensis]|uniref:Glycosyltransferase n=1 Tax=Metallosphaera tengchongensis TaxID=1532350 RepID=A0A6N0NTT0_9CREN|nr:glycosyltransferase family 2 protein [Metallosphaera tengchongensis]QKR00176.1 glycosyltransferase [Metallosphaera tengchongensis]
MNSFITIYLIFGSITLSLSLVYFLLISYFSVNSKKFARNPVKDLSDVTVLIPVYGEDEAVFRKVISSVARQGARILVVGDGCDEPYRSIVNSAGGEFLRTPERSGKRVALSFGINHVKSKYVLLLDSDTILPQDGLKNMLSIMDKDVGGVSVNVRNVKTGNTYYLAELIERLKEMTMRAVNGSGYAMLLNGKCSLYRVDLIKPFMQTDEFKYPTFLGRRALIGDDKQLTNYVISKGFKAIVDFETVALTYPPENLKKLSKQLLRWSRANYYFFAREIRDGTMLKRGPVYVYNFFYTTVLPFLLTVMTVLDLFFMDSVLADTNPVDYENAVIYGGNFILHLPLIIAKRLLFTFFVGYFPIAHLHPRVPQLHANLLPRINLKYSIILGHLANYLTIVPFVYSLWRLMAEEKLKTLVIGSLGLLIQWIVSFYALLTIWDQDKWLTR